MDTDASDTNFILGLPGQLTTFTVPASAIYVKFIYDVSNLCDKNGGGAERSVSDLAIVKLQRNLAKTELPQYLPVYTSGDFLDRVSNILGAPPLFFQGPLQIVGFAGNPSVRKTGTVTSQVNFELTCGFLGLGSCSAYWISYPDDGSTAHLEDGDSGGPFTFYPDGTTPTQFGVTKGSLHDPERYNYSPTWDNGNGNGGFIRSFLPDADNDGVEDASDNCPPSRCPYNVDACANHDQTDRDGDGIGDICDSCDPALCSARGWPISSCFNPGQFDADNDGAGDECDSCVLAANGPTMHDPSELTQQLDDQDLDGVGDACDNCNQPNGYKACKSSADCGGSACEGLPPPEPFFASPTFGVCAGGPTLGTACGSSGSNVGECGGTGTCIDIGENGRCAFQLDDPDHDGIGGQCDLCPNNSDTRINSNSNDAAEQHLHAAALGDICDPVPTFISRPNFGVTGDPNGSTANYTTFFSTAGVGEGGTSALAAAGFRYCSCLNKAGSALERAICLQTQCLVDDTKFGALGTEWGTVSTATNGTLTLPASSVSPVVDQRIGRFFNSDVNCDDEETHFLLPSEECRLGASQETLKWFHQTDIARGIVPADAAGHATGIFWSHVLANNASSSSRDSTTSGQLRDDHEYVTIPFVPIPSIPHQGFLPIPCLLGGCTPWWQPGWAIDPGDFIGNPSSLQEVSQVARLLVSPSQAVVAVRSAGDVQIDVTSSLSNKVLSALTIAQGQVTWLSPSEPAARGRQPGALVGAVIATPWRQSAASPSGLIANNGTLEVAGEFDENIVRPAAVGFPSASTSFVPADRDGARSLFSSREQSVYLLGGHFVGGASTHEIWKYDFRQTSWTHVFLPAQTGNLGPAMGDIVALTYDDTNRRMLVIDKTKQSTSTAHHGEDRGDRDHDGREHDRDFSQLLELDAATQTIHAIATFPRSEIFERVSLATQDDGSYILVGALRDHWIAFRFELASFQGHENIRWTGVAQGEGEVLDDPIRVTEGNVLPVLRRGAQDLVILSNSSFDRSGRRCDSL